MASSTRSFKEYLLLVLSAIVVVAVGPFAVVRWLEGDFGTAVLDAGLTFVMAIIFLYVFLTRKVAVPGVVMSAFFLIGTVATVYLRGAEQIYWAYPALVATYYMINPRLALSLSLLVVALLVPVLRQGFDQPTLAIVIVTLVVNLIFAFVFAFISRRQQRRLEKISKSDPLTGVSNRRAMDAAIDRAYDDFRHGVPASAVLVLDIDHFKQVNDRFGHQVGDSVLVAIAELLKSLSGAHHLYRFGGEEFVILARDTESGAACDLADQLRESIESASFAVDVKITVSVGVASLLPGEGRADWLRRADIALLAAKGDGRNCVRLAEV